MDAQTVRRLKAVPLVFAAGCLVLTGCTKAEKKATDATPTSSASSAGTSAPASKSASPTVAPTVAATLGGTCGDLLPVDRIDAAAGQTVIGQTAFIVGIPEPNIGRLAYLNCRYGVSSTIVRKKKVTATKVEIGISLYNSAAQANRRVEGTLGDYRSHGAIPTQVKVGRYLGTVLIGYGLPTLVVAAGQRTVAVTVSTAFGGAKPTTVLTALAAAAVDATNPTSDASPGASSSDAAPQDSASDGSAPSGASS